MGHVSELRPRLARALDDADHRGDRYAATALRATLHPLVCLMDDRVDRARDALARAQTSLPQREITIQHWHHMEQSALIELYTGAPGKAVDLVERQLPALRRAFLL